MSSRYVTKNGRTAKRGLFSNGIWHCDCDPRMPADKFQTKNGGKNHGRWFYTCQKPTPKRCGFFLWEDEAKTREEGAVLSNSRTEPAQRPETPIKKIGTPAKQTKLPNAQLPTPTTKSKPTPTPTKLTAIPPPSDDPDFDSLSDNDLASALDEFETPRKAARTSLNDSPSKKHRASTTSNHSAASSTTLPLHDDTLDADDVFTTPSTTQRPPPQASLYPSLPTPTHTSSTTTPSSTSITTTNPDPGPLAASILPLLHPLHPSPTLVSQITHLLNTHELRASGVAKSRDILRVSLQSKDKKIADLEARVKGLEVERETMRSVVGHLKSDMASGGGIKRGRRGKRDEARDEGEEGA